MRPSLLASLCTFIDLQPVDLMWTSFVFHSQRTVVSTWNDFCHWIHFTVHTSLWFRFDAHTAHTVHTVHTDVVVLMMLQTPHYINLYHISLKTSQNRFLNTKQICRHQNHLFHFLSISHTGEVCKYKVPTGTAVYSGLISICSFLCSSAARWPTNPTCDGTLLENMP